MFIASNPCNIRHAVSVEKKPIPSLTSRLMKERRRGGNILGVVADLAHIIVDGIAHSEAGDAGSYPLNRASRFPRLEVRTGGGSGLCRMRRPWWV